MFYDQKLLCFTTDFEKVWLVANLGIEKVNKDELDGINIVKLCVEISDYLTTKSLNVKDRLSLKLAANLVYGTVRIYCFQVDTLIRKLLRWFIEVHTSQIVVIKDRREFKEPQHVRVKTKGGRKKKIELTPTVDKDLGPSLAKHARPLDIDEIQIDIEGFDVDLERLLEHRRGNSIGISFTEPTGPQAIDWCVGVDFGEDQESILEHMGSSRIPVVSSIRETDSSPQIAPEVIVTAAQVHAEASPRILPGIIPQVPDFEKGHVEKVSSKRATHRRTKVPEVIETVAQEHAEVIGSPKSVRAGVSQAVGDSDNGQALEKISFKPSSTRKSAKKPNIKVLLIREKSRCFANICRCFPKESFYIDKGVCVNEECLIGNNFKWSSEVFRDGPRLAEDLGMSDVQQRPQSGSISQSRVTPQVSLRRTKDSSSGTPQPSLREVSHEQIREIQSDEFRGVSKEVSREFVPQEIQPQLVFPEASVLESVLPETHIQKPPLDEMNLEQEVVLDESLPLNTIINQLTYSQQQILNIMRNHDFDYKDLTIADVTDGHVNNKLTIAKSFFDILVLTKHKLVVLETEQGSIELKRIIKGPKFF